MPEYPALVGGQQAHCRLDEEAGWDIARLSFLLMPDHCVRVGLGIANREILRRLRVFHSLPGMGTGLQMKQYLGFDCSDYIWRRRFGESSQSEPLQEL